MGAAPWVGQHRLMIFKAETNSLNWVFDVVRPQLKTAPRSRMNLEKERANFLCRCAAEAVLGFQRLIFPNESLGELQDDFSNSKLFSGQRGVDAGPDHVFRPTGNGMGGREVWGKFRAEGPGPGGPVYGPGCPFPNSVRNYWGPPPAWVISSANVPSSLIRPWSKRRFEI